MKLFEKFINKGLVIETKNGEVFSPENCETVAIARDFDCDERRVVEMAGLYPNVNFESLLVISGTDAFTSNGDVVELKDIFGINDDDNNCDTEYFEKYSVVRLKECVHNGVIFTPVACYDKSKFEDFGMVTRYEPVKGNTSVMFGQNSLKIHPKLLERVEITGSDSFMNIFNYVSTSISSFSFNEDYNYMDITDDGKFVEYIAKSRLCRFNGDFWNKTLRERYATRKKIRGFFMSIFSGKDSAIDMAIMLYGKNDLKVDILSGRGVYEAFESDSNVMEESIGNSCMIDEDEEYFEIYEENAEIAVIRNDEGLIVARAVTWELENSEGDIMKFLDRIYVSDSSLVPVFKNWAFSNDYVCLSSQTYGGTSVIDKNGDYISLEDWYVQLRRSGYEYYPYVDTMNFKCGDRLYAINSIKRLQSTGGDYDTI